MLLKGPEPLEDDWLWIQFWSRRLGLAILSVVRRRSGVVKYAQAHSAHRANAKPRFCSDAVTRSSSRTDLFDPTKETDRSRPWIL
jgi:hypothetical protein